MQLYDINKSIIQFSNLHNLVRAIYDFSHLLEAIYCTFVRNKCTCKVKKHALQTKKNKTVYTVQFDRFTDCTVQSQLERKIGDYLRHSVFILI